MKTYVMTAYVEDELKFYSLNNQSFNPETHLYPFRLVGDDGEVMGYGLSNDANNFDPLDDYQGHWGCTEIEYWNPVSEIWEAKKRGAKDMSEELDEAQRNILVAGLTYDMIDSIMNDVQFANEILYESFAYGRIGYDNYSDGELIIACKESGLEVALKEAGVIE